MGKNSKEQLPEDTLLKALADMEELAKGESGMTGVGNKTPSTTAQANGGLSDEGDKKELAVKGVAGDESKEMTAKGGDKKKKTLSEWAKEEESEEAHKAMDDDDDESMDDDDEKEKEYKSETKKATISDMMKSDSSSGPVIDAVPVLESFVDTVSDAQNDLRKSVESVSELVQAQNRVIKSLAKVVMKSQEQIAELLDQPVGERKTVLHKSEVSERFEQPMPQVNKSDVLDILIRKCQAGEISPIDVTRYETTLSMDPALAKSVRDEIRKSMGA